MNVLKWAIKVPILVILGFPWIFIGIVQMIVWDSESIQEALFDFVES